jgi:hypothetical protein
MADKRNSGMAATEVPFNVKVLKLCAVAATHSSSSVDTADENNVSEQLHSSPNKLIR